jgi:hypothetical protein
MEMSLSQTIKQNNAQDDDDTTQYLLDTDDTGSYNNSANGTPYVADYIGHLESCFQVMATVGLKSDTLLLDSCLTVCLISNGSILHGIHMVNCHMHVCCNAGVQLMNQIGYLGDFPEPVWYDPKGVANILSLFIVQKYYRFQYDSPKGNSFIVLMPNKMTFISVQQ